MSSVLLGTWKRNYFSFYEANPAVIVQARLLDGETLVIRVSPPITDNEFVDAFFGLEMQEGQVRIITTPNCIQYTFSTHLLIDDDNIGDKDDALDANTLYGMLNHATDQMLTQYCAILSGEDPY